MTQKQHKQKQQQKPQRVQQKEAKKQLSLKHAIGLIDLNDNDNDDDDQVSDDDYDIEDGNVENVKQVSTTKSTTKQPTNQREISSEQEESIKQQQQIQKQHENIALMPSILHYDSIRTHEQIEQDIEQVVIEHWQEEQLQQQQQQQLQQQQPSYENFDFYQQFIQSGWYDGMMNREEETDTSIVNSSKSSIQGYQKIVYGEATNIDTLEKRRVEAEERERQRKLQEAEREKKLKEERERREREERERREREEQEQRLERQRQQELEEQKAQQAQKVQQEQEQKKRALLEQEQQKSVVSQSPTATVAAPTAVNTPPPNISCSERAYVLWKRRKQVVDDAYVSVEKFNTDPVFKSEMRPVRTSIQKFVNQVSCAKISVLERTAAIHDLIIKYKNEPIKYKYCLVVLAEKVVSKCECDVASELSSQQSARLAFPYALLMMFLCEKFPDCLDIFLGVMNRMCIYTVPMYYVAKEKSMSDEDFKIKCLGYKSMEERKADYYDRMSGIIALFAAFLQVDNPGGSANHRFYRVDHAWTWLAQFLNMKPIDISATVLDTFLRVAGWALHQQYKHQFIKLLAYVQRDFLPECPKNTDFKGPLATLQLFVGEALQKTRSLAPPLDKPEGRDLSDSTGIA